MHSLAKFSLLFAFEVALSVWSEWRSPINGWKSCHKMVSGSMYYNLCLSWWSHFPHKHRWRSLILDFHSWNTGRNINHLSGGWFCCTRLALSCICEDLNFLWWWWLQPHHRYRHRRHNVRTPLIMMILLISNRCENVRQRMNKNREKKPGDDVVQKRPLIHLSKDFLGLRAHLILIHVSSSSVSNDDA